GTAYKSEMFQLPVVMAVALVAAIVVFPAGYAQTSDSFTEITERLDSGSRWYYNATATRCYLAPGYDDESFNSERECYTSSQTPAELCNQQAIRGPCRAYIPGYYYYVEDGTCLRFVYGGCAGNGNRFPTKEECIAFCNGV
ncbi:hypothetical protein L9F63_019993, partial [Diploptera punctata]